MIKKYDEARTPYQRVLESASVAEENKQRLKRRYSKLNPAELKREITRLQNELIDMAAKKARPKDDISKKAKAVRQMASHL